MLPLDIKARALRKAYLDADQCDLVFHSTTGAKLLTRPEKAYFSDTPTFAVYAQAFGFPSLVLWVKTQLLELDLFTEVKVDADNDTLSGAARLFAHNYGWVKLTEFLLFMARFKLGYYGKFYGYFDPIAIGEAFLSFLKQRSIEIDRLECERKTKQREQQQLQLPEGYTSYTLYQELKERASKGDEKAIKELNKWKEISA